MDDSTKVTWSQVYQDFKGALSGAADALKTGSEHVYEVLVRQQVVSSISWVIVYIVLAIATYTTWRIVIRVVSNNEDQDLEPLYIVPSFMTIITIVIVCLTIITTVTGFVNPEYGAIKEVREFIR